MEERDRRADGDEHSRGSREVAVARSLRRAELLEAEDEQHGGQQVGKRYGYVHWFLGAWRPLNISSTRSVTTNPPTTLVVARITATRPSPMDTGDDAPAAMTIAPTRMMPWIAFVPDISGVCRMVGTLEITSMPTKMASTKKVSSFSSSELMASSAGRRQQLLRALAHDLSRVRDARALRDLVLEVEVDRSVLDQMQQQVGDVARVQLARMQRHRRGHVAPAHDHDAVHIDVRAGLGELHVATRLGGEVDDDRPGPHALDHVRRHQQRSTASRHRGGGDDHVGLRDVLADELALFAQELLGLLARVTALALL